MKPPFLSLIRVSPSSLCRVGEISTIWRVLKTFKKGPELGETLIFGFRNVPMAGAEVAR
jgi:hypothetical protein